MPVIRFFCVICGAALQKRSNSRDDVIECPACARQVPVPGLANMPGRATGCAPAFPPDVLALEVKFLCTACQSPLRADARWEGRGIICPVCGDHTRIPRWSNDARPPGKADLSQNVKAPEFSDAVRLSSEEIEFLSQPAHASQGAAA